MKPTIIAVLITFLGCTTASTQDPQPPAQTSQSTQATTSQSTQNATSQSMPAQAAAPQYKNLQVLPRDIPREQLIEIMRAFSRSLGVRCNHCHVVAQTEPKEVLDFPNDAKEEKRVARVMIQMTQQLNGDWMQRVEAAEHNATLEATPKPNGMRVGCWTCHRGQAEPEQPPPPEPAPAH